MDEGLGLGDTAKSGNSETLDVYMVLGTKMAASSLLRRITHKHPGGGKYVYDPSRLSEHANYVPRHAE